MGRVIYLFLIAPWWVYAAAAAGFLYLSEQVYQNELKERADATAALAQPVPDRVDLSAFDRQNDVGLADEVHIAGWINTDFNYHLRKTKKGSVRAEGYMYVLQGASDTSSTKQVRAIILMSEREKADFIRRISEFQVPGKLDETGHLYFAFNGVRTNEGSFSDLVNDAFKEQGLTKGPDFIVVEPFWEGREKGLTYTGDPQRFREKLWKLSGVLLVLAAIKFGLARRSKRRQSERDAASVERAIFASSPVASAGEKGAGFGRPDLGMSQPKTLRQIAAKVQKTSAERPGPELQFEASREALGLAKAGFLQRFIKASRKSQIILLGMVFVLPLCVMKPAFGGVLLPVALLVYIYWSIGTKVASSVREALEEVGLLKPRISSLAKQDPFSRLEAQARNVR
ncbi:hypothetical protein RA19_06755 [Leisingera sp. ANG-M1]|uniref:hypothetical protein n=1 Tax=Leisingera sp. ANG-M1 TaxID=1577895 RepID=UPI00057E77F8|nr:hypothetical protein [Leisingera sp. ANG-M1]KIC11709.1 hypothetical protein RA19_06755 [Leisingera sp. ANG-M1]